MTVIKRELTAKEHELLTRLLQQLIRTMQSPLRASGSEHAQDMLETAKRAQEWLAQQRPKR